jgi:hypothetical protein
MLPEQVDKALRALGEDGDRVRGVLEREFVDYLEKNKPEREARDLGGTISELGGNLLRPATAEAGKRLAKELFKPDGGSFNEVMDRIQARREARKTESDGEPAGGSTEPGKPSAPAAKPSRWERRPVGRRAPPPR